MLHHDQELFEDLILRVSLESGIDAAIIEKDYYVSLLLSAIRERVPEIIFKGGTSLSKCYHLIDRFSEDIDLSIFESVKPTEGQRRKLKEHIIAAIAGIGFVLDNPEDIRSRREFNRYVITYPSVFDSSSINQKLIIETAVFMGIYPTEERPVGNYIYDYLERNALFNQIDSRDIQPFSVKVQRPERTFVDKVFALGDYYLAGTLEAHSRHIYDLYKLMDIVTLDHELEKLIAEVRTERKGHKTCLSAQDNINVSELLKHIAETDAFKTDYDNITYYLLFRKVPYEEAKRVLLSIAEKKLF